jgi:archaellum component FlaC
MTQGANQETMHTLEKEQAGIKNDISTLKTDVAILKTDVAIIKNDIVNIKENMATKADIANLKTEFREDIAKLSGCVAMIRAESKEDNNNLRIELKQDIHNLQSNMQGWMITILIAIIGGIIALLYKS